MQIQTSLKASAYSGASSKRPISNEDNSTRGTNNDSFQKSEPQESGFFSTRPTTMGNIKKFAPTFMAVGMAAGALTSLAVGGNLGLGLAIGGGYGGFAGLIYGAGRPTS